MEKIEFSSDILLNGACLDKPMDDRLQTFRDRTGDVSLQGAADESAPWRDGPLSQFRGAATVVLLLVLGGIPQAGPLCVLFCDLHYGAPGFLGRYS